LRVKGFGFNFHLQPAFMNLFTKLFLNTLLAILVAQAVLITVAFILPQRELRTEVEEFQSLSEEIRVQLLDDFSRDSRRGLLGGLLASLPIATVVAAVTTLRESRRVGRGVKHLAEASQRVAAREFGEEVDIQGQDELSDLAENFNDMAAALAHNEQDRNELISTVAHELRTPLAALQGYGEALADGVMSPEAASLAINREVAAMRKIANDLMLVSKAESGTLEVHPSRLAVKVLLEDAEDRFKSMFEAKAISFQSVLQVGVTEVWADRERAGQVLANLLSNALKYTPRNGSVTVGAERQEGCVRFYVKDTGPGIALKHQAHIFERFYRVDDSRERSKGGLGVGLTVSKKLVEAMGGTMWLESTAGKGATFSFTLPLAGEE
jgi:signal transduction histidine kinase